MTSRLLLLPWCMVTAGDQINNNSEQELATNKQANRYQVQALQQE